MPDQQRQLFDCKKCKEMRSVEQRQMIGCGYERPAPGAVPWQPPVSQLGYKHPRPTVCAAFSTKLPEVEETARAHLSWSHGSISAFTGGQPATESLVAHVEILDAEISRVQRWAMTPVKDGGGRHDH
jgi:hypothetical protein